MNRFLTFASSGLVASGLAILPVAAFAQATTAPAKATSTAPAAAQTTAPAMTSGKTAAPMAPSTATTPAPAMAGTAKSDLKAPAHDGKTEVHGMNASKTHHAVVKTPAASVPAKG